MVLLSRTPPALNKDVRGQWVVTLQCVDRIANHQVEPWALFWKGQDAADFYAHHREKLVPGTPLTVCVDNMRSHTMGRTVEISARVNRLALAPAAQPKTEAA